MDSRCRHRIILCFLISHRTQHLRHQNVCVIVFMCGTCVHMANVHHMNEIETFNQSMLMMRIK